VIRTASYAGVPRCGQPAQRNASPLPQLPQADLSAEKVAAASSEKNKNRVDTFIPSRKRSL